jgi:hypothetical protein
MLTYSVASLHVDCAWARELANKTLSGSKTGNDAARGNAFHDVLGIPCDKVTVIDQILLPMRQL